MKNNSRKKMYGLAGIAVISSVVVASVLLITSSNEPEVAFSPGEPTVRRLSAEQYHNVISDIFGSTIQLGGRFEPELRVEGLLGIGASAVSVSASGIQQYDAMARNIASQVMDESRRELFIACKPEAPQRPDDACAGEFLGGVGSLLFRRPLTENEQSIFTQAAREATVVLGDFYDGTALALAAILTSPQFLFREETLEPDLDNGGYRLDAYSKASRLSFFLWNSNPDFLLFKAAESGDLDTDEGLKHQVERMIASPRLETGVRAFFADMLEFDKFGEMTKDALIYPKWNSRVADDAQEMTLKTIVHLLLEENADYREIFTTKKTFLTPALASIYQVPLINSVPNGAGSRWYPFEFPEEDPRSGILMHTSFLTLHSHPGRGSPTLRGAALREIMMCQNIPAPPPDVNFDVLQNPNETHRTARERLNAHNEVASCAGCHRVMDPMGFALENFDGGGEWRLRENGALIDTRGELDGMPFKDGAELGQVVHQNPAVTSCIVDRMTSYALGRTPVRSEREWMNQLKKSFEDADFVLPEFMRLLAIDSRFYRAAQPARTGELISSR